MQIIFKNNETGKPSRLDTFYRKKETENFTNFAVIKELKLVAYFPKAKYSTLLLL